MDIFDGPNNPPLKEKFEYHTLIITLDAGEGDGNLSYKVKCSGAERDDCACNEGFCQLEDTIKMVGLLDALRVGEDIELVQLDARMDWSDPEEPWVEVKLP